MIRTRIGIPVYEMRSLFLVQRKIGVEGERGFLSIGLEGERGFYPLT